MANTNKMNDTRRQIGPGLNNWCLLQRIVARIGHRNDQIFTRPPRANKRTVMLILLPYLRAGKAGNMLSQHLKL